MDEKERLTQHMIKIFQDSHGRWDEVADDDDYEFPSEEEDLGYSSDDWEDPNDEDPEEFEAIAIRLMDILTENKLDSYAILKDPIIAEWWGMIVKERAKKAEKLRKIEEARLQQEEDARARQSLLARLTPEERRLLGIK